MCAQALCFILTQLISLPSWCTFLGTWRAGLPEVGLAPLTGPLKELVQEIKGTNDLLRVTTHIIRKQFALQFRYTSSQATKFRSPVFKQELLEVRRLTAL